jgi:hypothetical protein
MSELIQDRQSSIGIAGQPGSATTPPVAEGAPGRRRLLNRWLVLGSVVAGLIVGGALLLLQPFGGSGEAPGEAPVSAQAPAGAGTGGDPAAAGGDGGAGAEAGAGEAEAGEAVPAKPRTARLTSRDPFAPLVTAPEEPKVDDSPKPADAEQAAPSPAKGGTISALKVAPLGDSVTLKLDGKKYTVDEGETFAKSYRLYDIFNDDCAGFLYGDRNAIVCSGDSVTVG